MQKHPFTWIVNKASNNTAEILLYGFIGDCDITAAAFVKELHDLEKDYSNINIRINSGGGSVYEGFAIFNAIKNSPAAIDTYIDGMAASMATVVALAGRKVYMSRLANFMTHRAAGGAYGDADELRQTAEMMEGLENAICSIYARRTGMTTKEAKDKYLTGKDRWIDADQALGEKLIDGIYDGEKIAAPAPKNATEKEMWGFYNGFLGDPENSSNEIFYLI